MENEKLTSACWQMLYPNPRITDPKGWDKYDFYFSWYEEEITIEEYRQRLSKSK